MERKSPHWFLVKHLPFLLLLRLITLVNINYRYDNYGTYTKEKKSESTKITQSSSKRRTGDYCTEGGEVCLYNKICYEISSGTWQTTNVASSKTAPLLGNRGLSIPELWPPPYNKCYTAFAVQNVQSSPYFDTNTRLVTGNTYYMCCFIHHFGEILTNMLASVFRAIWEVGMHDEVGSFNYLIENRVVRRLTRQATLTSMIDTITGQSGRDLILNVLIEEAKADGNDYLCFEKLVVGMYHDTMVSEEINPELKLKMDMTKTFRDQMSNANPATPENIQIARKETIIEENEATKHFPPECTLTYLIRETNARVVSNRAEVIEVIRDVFPENEWHFQIASFDHASFEAQYLTIQGTSIFLSVTGSGAHMAMFLPEGGTNIELAFFNHNEVINRYICATSPWMQCSFVDCLARYESTEEEYQNAKQNNITVSLFHLRKELEATYNRHGLRCMARREKEKQSVQT